jgi:1-acyl-sn-glycerol-3-phosphate acyltransferase
MKRVLEILFSSFIWVVGLVTFFLLALFILIIGVFFQGSVFEKSVKFGSKLIIFIMGIQVSAMNLENYDYKKQYIVMMNHVNMFDPFMIYACFKGKARGMHIPISRKKGRKAIESLKKAVRLIKSKKGISVVILPEGTRTLDGKLGKFKKGGFLLALESGLDILPVIQKGSYRIKRRGSWIIKPGKVEY